MSFQVYTYQHPDFGPIMLLVDDQAEPQLPSKQQAFQSRPRNQSIRQGSNSMEKKQSVQRHIKSLQRKKSNDNGLTLPLIPSKKSHFK